LLPFAFGEWIRWTKDTGKSLIKQGEFHYSMFPPQISRALNSYGPDVQDPSRNYKKGWPIGFDKYNWVRAKRSLQLPYYPAATVSQPCRAKPDTQAQFKQ